MLWTAAIVCIVAFIILILKVLSEFISAKPIQLNGAHVLVTGGSSGIGKCLAVEAAKYGASITLLARNQLRLTEAKDEVVKHITDNSKQKVQCVSVDVTKEFSILEDTVNQIEEKQGPITALINCAGTSMSARFLDTPVGEFKRMMDINYLGSVLLTRAVIPSLVRQRKGRVVFVSSVAGQMGLYGYTAYSASKFALRGLAESLQMELQPYNIQVMMAFPPDTDTPGFAEEQKMKPKATQLISEAGGLFQPEIVARKIMQDMVKGNFSSSVGLDGYIVNILTCGFSPVFSLFQIVQQVVMMGLFRLICVFYLASFGRIVKKCEDEMVMEKKES